jgi:hypothetical protein
MQCQKHCFWNPQNGWHLPCLINTLGAVFCRGFKTGTSDLWDEPIYINKYGTLQTSDGAIKRMGD